jgi:hypothetical protein
MEFNTRWIGKRICELTVRNSDAYIREDVCDFTTGKIDEHLIYQLRQIADEFEEHNESLE